LNAYADAGDLAILISSSGNSKNIINGANKAKNIGLSVITVSGFLTYNTLKQKLGNMNRYLNKIKFNHTNL
jgi:D-sedoheptulose 7-phosphate isomerase